MRLTGRGNFVWQLGLLLLLWCGIAHGTGGETEKSFPKKTSVIRQGCQRCHVQQYSRSIHSTNNWKTVPEPSERAFCERCHGDGTDHMKKGGGRGVAIFAFDDAADQHEKSARCLSCHYQSPDLALWEMGAHSRNGLSCDNCHTQHPGERKKVQQQDVCFDCHRRVKVEANKRSHHPILEGKLVCSSCHQPHGTMTRGLIKGNNAQMLCYSCHAEKRGPAVWNHPPVEENCQTCHRPHGSTHASLLVERVPQLCKNCHDWSRNPGSPYAATADRNSGKCLQSHPAIHGSSAPSGGGPRFSR